MSAWTEGQELTNQYNAALKTDNYAAQLKYLRKYYEIITKRRNEYEKEAGWTKEIYDNNIKNTENKIKKLEETVKQNEKDEKKTDSKDSVTSPQINYGPTKEELEEYDKLESECAKSSYDPLFPSLSDYIDEEEKARIFEEKLVIFKGNLEKLKLLIKSLEEKKADTTKILIPRAKTIESLEKKYDIQAKKLQTYKEFKKTRDAKREEKKSKEDEVLGDGMSFLGNVEAEEEAKGKKEQEEARIKKQEIESDDTYNKLKQEMTPLPPKPVTQTTTQTTTQTCKLCRSKIENGKCTGCGMRFTEEAPSSNQVTCKHCHFSFILPLNSNPNSFYCIYCRTHNP